MRPPSWKDCKPEEKGDRAEPSDTLKFCKTKPKSPLISMLRRKMRGMNTQEIAFFTRAWIRHVLEFSTQGLRSF